MKETNSYELLLDSEEQLKGLPESIIETAAHTAKEKGKNGWIIILQAPSYVPFMKYSENANCAVNCIWLTIPNVYTTMNKTMRML